MHWGGKGCQAEWHEAERSLGRRQHFYLHVTVDVQEPPENSNSEKKRLKKMQTLPDTLGFNNLTHSIAAHMTVTQSSHFQPGSGDHLISTRWGRPFPSNLLSGEKGWLDTLNNHDLSILLCNGVACPTYTERYRTMGTLTSSISSSKGILLELSTFRTSNRFHSKKDND